MSADSKQQRCDRAELMGLYALHALPSGEARLLEEHLVDCPQCQRDLRALRPVVDSFVFWPADVLPAPESMWAQLRNRIGAESPEEPAVSESHRWQEPEWERVAPGISCKLLATDTERDRVSMLVRLDPGVAYPPHRHAGVEELFLLHGELWIDDRKLFPGDYNRGEPGALDERVWTETGCTCVLITSSGDVIS